VARASVQLVYQLSVANPIRSSLTSEYCTVLVPYGCMWCWFPVVVGSAEHVSSGFFPCHVIIVEFLSVWFCFFCLHVLEPMVGCILKQSFPHHVLLPIVLPFPVFLLFQSTSECSPPNRFSVVLFSALFSVAPWIRSFSDISCCMSFGLFCSVATLSGVKWLALCSTLLLNRNA